MSAKNFTRRDFIKTSTLAIASSTLISSNSFLIGKTESKTKVILIRDKNVIDDKNKVNSQVLEQMLDDAVKLLFEKGKLKKID